MREVFICDAARTPIGRYGGALAKVRTDDLAAVPIKALVARNTKADWIAARRSVLRLRQPVRRRQSQRRAHGAAAWPGLPELHPRHHRQPAVRLGAQRGRRRNPRHPLRRDGLRHRRRRRIDDAGALRHGQGRRGVLALGGDLRHHARLALHQSAAQGAIRRRTRWPRPARTSPKIFRSPAPTRTRLRCARNSALPKPWPPAISPKRSCRSRRRAARAVRSRSTKTSIRGRRPRWKICKSSNPSRAIPAPSPPAMPPVSTTAPPPLSSPAKTRRRCMGSPRAPACSAWPRPRCRRASWASARCRRPGS